MTNINIPTSLVTKYIIHRNEDLEKCYKALEDFDYEFLINKGHQIKGNAASFGFEELGKMAAELEIKAQNKDNLNLKLILDQFKKHLILISK